jgi:hypothetical protein
VCVRILLYSAVLQVICFVDILLGTVMTIGAAGEGQPVLFFLVGAESTAELSPVFEVLAKR